MPGRSGCGRSGRRRAGPPPAGRPAADPLDEHLVRFEDVTVDLEAPAVELLEVAARESLSHFAQRGAETRAEGREVRLHLQLGRLDLPELDVLDAQLVGDLISVSL